MHANRLVAAAFAILILAGAPALAQDEPSPLDRLIARADGLKGDFPALRSEISSRQARANVARFNLGTGLTGLGGTQQGIDEYRTGEGALIPLTVEDQPVDPRELVDKQGLKIFYAMAGAGASPDDLLRVGTLLDPKAAFTAGEWTHSDVAMFKRFLDNGTIKLEDFYALAVLLDHEVTMHSEALDALLDREIAYAATLEEIEAERERLRDVAELKEMVQDAASTPEAAMVVEDQTGLIVEEIDWWRTALSADAGRIYLCPPRGDWDSVISVDGTDRYYLPSQICHAALHFGAIGVEGGFVRLRLYPEDEGFKAVASTRNGISSTDYGWQHLGTFSFVAVLQ